MPEHPLRSAVRDRIEEAVARAETDLPALTNLLEAFKELLVESAVMKAELLADAPMPLPEVDKDAFRQGVPFADAKMFLVSRAHLMIAAERIGQAIRKGFPRLHEAVRMVVAALADGTLDAEKVSWDLLKGNNDALEQAAISIHVDPDALRFVMGRFIKPFVEARAQWIAPKIEGLEWTRGYCPICGSWPSMSIIKEKEGQRWLMCSLCSHEWRFMRVQCPFCDNQVSEELEIFFSEGRASERAEACHACKKYLVSIDVRDRVDDPVMEVVPLMLVYLDLLAQSEGFSPGALTDWNVLE